MYNFGGFLNFSPSLWLFPISCRVHAVCAALVEWEQRFPVVPAPS